MIFEKSEVVKSDDTPYLVYTPYMKKWKEVFKSHDLKIYYTNDYLSNLIENTRLPNLSLSDIGFKKSSIQFPEYDVTPTTIQEYENNRNLPAKESTSNLSPHLRFGTISIRKVLKKALERRIISKLDTIIYNNAAARFARLGRLCLFHSH